MRQISNAAAALAVIAALASCSNNDPAASGPAGNAETPTTDAPAPEYQIITADSRPIEAGTWALHADGGRDAPLAVFEVPDGFHGGGPFLWTNRAVIGYWTVAGVHDNPCKPSGRPRSAGVAVDDLTAALAAQQLTTTSKPVPVSIDGHDGVYVELSPPADFPFDNCVEDMLHIWETSAGGVRSIGEPMVDRYWILDVDGQRVVLHVGAPAEVTGDDIRLFSGMVEGASFVED